MNTCRQPIETATKKWRRAFAAGFVGLEPVPKPGCGRKLHLKTRVLLSQQRVLGLLLILCAVLGKTIAAAEPQSTGHTLNLNILSTQQWKQIDAAVDEGLDFIVGNQRRDGSFAAPRAAQPGVTSLCVMAFLSRGHLPGQGPYGDQIERAIQYTLSTQDSNGLLSHPGSRPNYNHAITGLMLGEVYGMTSDRQNERIRIAIREALRFSRQRQTRRKRHPRDKGGWRYLKPYGPNDSDLTATSWQLMFYRSAKNAEFDVPPEYIDEAMGYVRRCFDRNEQAFMYALAHDEEHYASGGTVGGGIVALEMGGEHHSEMAKAGAKWILSHPFDRYNVRRHSDDRYHYSAFYCSQAMFHLGGENWEKFYPPLQSTLLANQRRDGSWDRERVHDSGVGNTYTTALVVLTLTPPYQILPIYQR